jgi:hypothetical protein
MIVQPLSSDPVRFPIYIHTQENTGAGADTLYISSQLRTSSQTTDLVPSFSQATLLAKPT